MSETFKAVLVDPFTQAISEHDLEDGELFNNFLTGTVGDDRGWNVLVGADAAGASPGVQFVLHDWAVTQPDQRFFRIPPYPYALGGKVVFVGFHIEGDTCSVPDGFADMLRQRVQWCPASMRFVRFEDRQEGARFIRDVVFEGEQAGGEQA